MSTYDSRGTGITHRELYGTRLQLLLWTGLLGGPPLFAFYGLAKYPPLIPDPRELTFVALGVFVVAAPFIFALRKKLMPWGDKAPVIMWFNVLFLPLIPIALSYGGFLVANAKLDHSSPADVPTVIDWVHNGKRVTLHSIAHPDNDIFFDLNQIDHDNVEHGDSVRLHVKPGALGIPWITGYTLHRIPEFTPTPKRRTSASVVKSKP